jgi:hypothetical protein
MGEADRIEEMRANSFAACTLMPEEEVRDLAGKHVPEDSFARLVGHFRVSPDALAWRLKALGLISARDRASLGANAGPAGRTTRRVAGRVWKPHARPRAPPAARGPGGARGRRLRERYDRRPPSRHPAASRLHHELRRCEPHAAFRDHNAGRGRWTQAVEDIRMALGGIPSEPLRHLGEAESIRAIESRADLYGAIFLTDDGDARYLAAHRGITVRNTKWLVADAYSMGDIQCPEPYEILKMMWEANRPIVLPESHKEICP